jgi:zinc protease
MFWLSQFSGATSEPMRVDNLLSWGADLKTMTPANLQKLAKRYLKANKTFSMVVAPESTGQAK